MSIHAILGAAALVLAGCPGTPSRTDGGAKDIAGTDAARDLAGSEGGAVDMTGDGAATDGGADLAGADLAMLDLTMPDLTTPDLTARDLTVLEGAVADLTADLTTPTDLTPPPDLTVLDLTGDSAIPDLAPAVPMTFYVLRVGDGNAALSSASTAGFFEQRKLTDGSLVGVPIGLPTAANGSNQPLTFSGSATSEGQISRAANGRYVVVAGYAAATGIASIASTMAASTNRVIGRIDAAGNVDTSTRLTGAFDTSNIRCATTVDGSAFWASGTGSTATSGIIYALYGQADTGVQVVATPGNTRVVHVFNGQLYLTSGSGSYNTVLGVGALPTMAGAMVTPLLAPATGPSPYSFALLDRDPNIAGVDTLYLSDDRSLASGGGIFKYTFDGTTWKASTTVLTGGLTTGVRGLAAYAFGSTVTILATEAVSSANNAVLIVDDGSMNPMARVLVTAPTNTAYRGIAFAPL